MAGRSGQGQRGAGADGGGAACRAAEQAPVGVVAELPVVAGQAGQGGDGGPPAAGLWGVWGPAGITAGNVPQPALPWSDWARAPEFRVSQPSAGQVTGSTA